MEESTNPTGGEASMEGLENVPFVEVAPRVETWEPTEEELKLAEENGGQFPNMKENGGEPGEEGREGNQDGAEGEPGAEGQPQEGGAVQPAEENPLQTALNEALAKVSHYEEQAWNQEVIAKRKGDLANGIAPDPLYGYPPEIQLAYKEVTEPMEESVSNGLKQAGEMAIRKHLGGLIPHIRQMIANSPEVVDFADVEPVINAAINGLWQEMVEGLPSVAKDMAQQIGIRTADMTYRNYSTAQMNAIETHQARAAMEGQIGEMKKTLAESGLSFTDAMIKDAFTDFGEYRQNGLGIQEAMEKACKPLKAAYDGMLLGSKQRQVENVQKRTGRAAANAFIGGTSPGADKGGPRTTLEVYKAVDSGKMTPKEGEEWLKKLHQKSA